MATVISGLLHNEQGAMWRRFKVVNLHFLTFINFWLYLKFSSSPLKFTSYKINEIIQYLYIYKKCNIEKTIPNSTLVNFF
jgi:hypothetical protein